MNFIAAVDNNWAIGYKNRLLIQIPSDMKRFREITTGKVVVLGRKTLETFPQQQPLPNRVNIILSRNKNYKVKGAIVVHSKEELLEELKKYDDNEIFIIGGSTIYDMMYDYCDTAYITKIDHSYAADSYIKNLDKTGQWEIVEESEEHTCFDIIFRYLLYKRIDK